MGFVRRLNSKELVGDPCAGAEVYPITATNAVYREGGENLEEILTNLGNRTDESVTDVKIKSEHATNSIVTNSIAEIPDFPVNFNILLGSYFAGDRDGMYHHIKYNTANGDEKQMSGYIRAPYIVDDGTGNALNTIRYNRGNDNRFELVLGRDIFINKVYVNGQEINISTLGNDASVNIIIPVTDVQIRGTSVVNNNIANMDIVKNNNNIHAVQYVASETAYQSMTKDPNTLYFIPVESN